jgi:hypothetical protein
MAERLVDPPVFARARQPSHGRAPGRFERRPASKVKQNQTKTCLDQSSGFFAAAIEASA